MTYEELMDTIKNSTQSDWIHNDVRGVWTYKHDLMIHFREDRDEDQEREERQFHEKWVEKFPDKTAYRVTYAIYYGNSFVEDVIAVSVDGHRTIIPLPKSQNNLVITQWQYRFGKILDREPNGPYGLDAQMKHAGIRIE
jgi:hypothetical protein